MKRDLPETEERLRLWGSYYRDRYRWNKTLSIEGNFQPGSDDYIREGWGDPEKAPNPPPKKRNWILDAHAVQDAVTRISRIEDGRLLAWALTYHYAYPFLPKGLVLRVMRKHNGGRRMNWQTFELWVERGVYRVAALLA